MRVILIVAACLALGACASNPSACAGWEKLSPSSGTRGYIVANDQPFAKGVAAHNKTGHSRGCW